MNKAVEVKNLNVSYGANKVLEDIDLSIPGGRLIGILGPNGAGKSTLIKAILGLISIDRGEIKISNKR